MWEVMAECGAVTTPRAKRRTILSSIARFEKRLAQAPADLSQAKAYIALFEASGGKRLADRGLYADLILRRPRASEGPEGCSRDRVNARTGASFEAASRRLRTRGVGGKRFQANAKLGRERRRPHGSVLFPKRRDGQGAKPTSRRRAHRASRDARLSTGNERALDRLAASEGSASMRATARGVGKPCDAEQQFWQLCLCRRNPVTPKRYVGRSPRSREGTVS